MKGPGRLTHVKQIIFDCDGVLIDSEILANRLEVEVKNELGFPITLEEQIRKFVGMGKIHPDVQAELKRLPEHYWDLVDERIGPIYERELQAIAGAREFLESLTLPFCVASSSEPEWLLRKLKITRLDHHFDGRIFHGRLVERCKPAPDLFLHALKELAWRAEQTLVIEDSVLGVQAGRAAGLTVCGFLGGAHILPGHADRLNEAGADFLVSNFSEVQACLAALP